MPPMCNVNCAAIPQSSSSKVSLFWSCKRRFYGGRSRSPRQIFYWPMVASYFWWNRWKLPLRKYKGHYSERFKIRNPAWGWVKTKFAKWNGDHCGHLTRHLKPEVAEHRFVADLFHSDLACFPIKVPAVARSPRWCSSTAGFFCWALFVVNFRPLQQLTLSPSAINLLENLPIFWPGKRRELEACWISPRGLICKGRKAPKDERPTSITYRHLRHLNRVYKLKKVDKEKEYRRHRTYAKDAIISNDPIDLTRKNRDLPSGDMIRQALEVTEGKLDKAAQHLSMESSGTSQD